MSSLACLPACILAAGQGDAVKDAVAWTRHFQAPGWEGKVSAWSDWYALGVSVESLVVREVALLLRHHVFRGPIYDCASRQRFSAHFVICFAWLVLYDAPRDALAFGPFIPPYTSSLSCSTGEECVFAASLTVPLADADDDVPVHRRLNNARQFHDVLRRAPYYVCQ